MKKIISIILSIFMLVSPVLAEAKQKSVINGTAGKPKLSLATAVDKGIKHSFDIKSTVERQKQADISIDQARASYYPKIDVFAEAGEEYNEPFISQDGDADPTVGDNISSYNAVFTVNQTIFDGFETDSLVEKSKDLSDSARYLSQDARERVAISTIKEYTKIYENQKKVSESFGYLNELQKLMKKVKVRAEKGAGDKVKIKYVETQMNNAYSQLYNLGSEMQNTILKMETMIGEKIDHELDLPDHRLVLAYQMPFLLDSAAKNNTGIKVNEADKRALSKDLEAARAAYYPDVNVLVKGQQSHNVGGDVGRDRNASAMLQVNYNLFEGFATDKSVEKIKSQMAEINYKIANDHRNLREDVTLLYNEIKYLESEMQNTQRQIRTTKELYELQEKQFRLGEGDLINLTDTLTDLYNHTNKAYEVESDLVLKKLELARDAGILFNEISKIYPVHSDSVAVVNEDEKPRAVKSPKMPLPKSVKNNSLEPKIAEKPQLPNKLPALPEATVQKQVPASENVKYENPDAPKPKQDLSNKKMFEKPQPSIAQAEEQKDYNIIVLPKDQVSDQSYPWDLTEVEKRAFNKRKR